MTQRRVDISTERRRLCVRPGQVQMLVEVESGRLLVAWHPCPGAEDCSDAMATTMRHV